MKFLVILQLLPLICWSHSSSTREKYPSTTDDATDFIHDHSHHHSHLPSTAVDASENITDTVTETYTWIPSSTEDNYIPISNCYALRARYFSPYLRPGQRAKFECECRFRGRALKENCPEWRGVDGVLHSHTYNLTSNKCVRTLLLENVTSIIPKSLVCADIRSYRAVSIRINFQENSYGEPCQTDLDCKGTYACNNFRCDCPKDEPIYIEGFLTRSCYPVRKLLSSCNHCNQCLASDKNSFCYRKKPYVDPTGLCLCDDGYMDVEGECLKKATVYTYVYGFTKRYRTVFYVLLSLSLALVSIGLLRACLMRRHVQRRRPFENSISNLDITPLTPETEKNPEKVRF